MKAYRYNWGPAPARYFRLFAVTTTIWLVLPFLLVTDLIIELYHRTSFPLYGIDLLKRGDYIVIDRVKLSYLSTIQKINCMYCGYANGVIAYWLAIASETENFWCGIQHQHPPKTLPTHYDEYAKYGERSD